MRALIITGKQVQDHEFIYPYYRLQEEGYEVDVAVKGKETVFGAIGTKIVPTHDIPELNITDYSILILPGGAKAMEYMRQDDDIIGFIQHFYRSRGVIGSICHAAQLLITARLVQGKKISGYYSIKDDIRNAGGTYIDAPFVIDGRIISSPHYKHLGPWMKAVLTVTKANV